MKEGTDVTIFGTGSILNECMMAANELENQKISVKVVNLHTIKPIDKDIIVKSMESKLFISVEEHNVIGGLGSAIAEIMAEYNKKPKHIMLGINDFYEKGGSYKYLLNKYGLNKEKIINTAISNLK